MSAKTFLLFFRPVQRLPLSFHYRCGKVVSWVASKVLRYRWDVVTVNLSRSFPQLDYRGIASLRKGFYDHLGELFAEAMWFGGNDSNPSRIRREGVAKVLNVPLLTTALDRGDVMLLCSHFGNWELTSGLLEAMRGEDGTLPVGPDKPKVVYKRLRSGFWDDFLRANRTAPLPPAYDGYLESSRILRYALSHRGEKNLYIFPVDQYPYRGAAYCTVPSFMNQETRFMSGAAALSRRMGMAVLYMSFDRVGRGRYEVTFKEVCPDASLFEVEDIVRIYASMLEEDIRRNPLNYLWSHRRWKVPDTRQVERYVYPPDRKNK